MSADDLKLVGAVKKFGEVFAEEVSALGTGRLPDSPDLPAAPGAGSAAPGRVELPSHLTALYRETYALSPWQRKRPAEEFDSAALTWVLGLAEAAALSFGAAAAGSAARVAAGLSAALSEIEAPGPEGVTEARAMIAAALSSGAPAAGPAAGAVPAAWRFREDDAFPWRFTDYEPMLGFPHVEPLYAAAPPREASAAEGTAAGPGGDGDRPITEGDLQAAYERGAFDGAAAIPGAAADAVPSGDACALVARVEDAAASLYGCAVKDLAVADVAFDQVRSACAAVLAHVATIERFDRARLARGQKAEG